MNIAKWNIAKWIPVLLISISAISAPAQTCMTAADMDPATASALKSTAARYYDMAARGDSASLRQNAIPGLASNFAGIESAVKDSQSNLTGVPGVPRPAFLLKAEGSAPLE